MAKAVRKQVVVVGGSIAGLATGLALSRQEATANGDAPRVLILERDATPMPASPVEAFERWERKGSPQTRHSHAFLARLHNLLRDEAPQLHAELLSEGVEQLRFAEIVEREFPQAQLIPEDEDVTLLACRRITFEWVLRKHILDSGRVEFRDGVTVQGLESERDISSGLPRVTGVRVMDRERGEAVLPADLVIDATGRRSKLPQWLEAIGASPMREESEDCGIFYSTRFYRVREDAETPPFSGVVGADLGYLKYGIFPGDGGIFSVTLCAAPDDDPLRCILRDEGFDFVASQLPNVKDWVDPAIAEPVTRVHGMADLHNSRRFYCEDGRPRALGLQPVGDALIHTNPLNGRGCTLAFVNAFLLADCAAEHGDDLLAFHNALDEAVSREIVPWYEATRAQDRDAREVGRMHREGRDPFATQREDGSVDPKAYMRSVLRDGLVPALREDIEVMRAFMRIFNLLEAPQDLMKNPTLFSKVLAAYNRREQREARDLGPDRAEMLSRIESLAAA